MALFFLLINGCQSQPTQPNPAQGSLAGFKFEKIRSTQFDHWLATPENTTTNLRCLTIYLEGDGVPFLAQGSRISTNPTGYKNPLLQLSQKDTDNAIWLGRPCYFGLQTSRHCHPHLWTFGRYSEKVVDSLTERVKTLAANKHIILVGHSGGGVLAALIAQRSPQVTAIVTLAAPLDIDSWTSSHGYSPLYDSLNPAKLTPTRPNINQLHLTGDLDTEVTFQHQQKYMQRYPNAQHAELSGVSHNLDGLTAENWLALIQHVRTANGCHIND